MNVKMKGLIAAGVLFRIAYTVWMAHHGIISLDDDYYARAVSLYSGQGFLGWHHYPTALFMPGYSLLLAGVFWLSGGPSHFAAYLTQITLGILSIAIVYKLGTLLVNRDSGLLAAAILAWFPSQIVLGTFIQSDLFFEVALWGGVLTLGLSPKGTVPRTVKGWIFILASGVLFGWASLTRPYGIVFVLIYCAWMLRKNPRPIVGVLLVTVLIHGIWIARNENVFHRFVPFTSGGGVNLWVANHPGASGKFDYIPGEFFFSKTPDAEITYDEEMKHEAVGYIRNHPLVFLSKIPKKWIYLWGSDSTLLGQVLFHLNVRSGPVKMLLTGITNAYYLVFFLLAIVSCVKHLRKLIDHPIGSFGILMFFGMLGIFAVYHVETRFHVPFVPAIALYATLLVARFQSPRDSAESRLTAP